MITAYLHQLLIVLLFVMTVHSTMHQLHDDGNLRWSSMRGSLEKLKHRQQWRQLMQRVRSIRQGRLVNNFDRAELQKKPSTSPTGDSSVPGQHWAVLVAGSNTWYNYRHQADVCHAYHILLSRGIPASNIITMMFDDIANNKKNPHKGVIINRLNGTNVYAGVQIDYRDKEVTPANFLGVLTGSELLQSRGKKVLKSGPNDRVFIYFSDHGAPGLVAFPNDVLHAKDLSNAFMKMQQKQMYKEIVFYLEACESGSMFEHGLLPDSLNIYGLTAANDHESSYACYMDPKLDTFVGDCFSVNWMEDSEAHDISQETLQSQYDNVKTRTTESHVMQYGNLNITSEEVSEFQGNDTIEHLIPLSAQNEKPLSVPQGEVELYILLWKHRRASNDMESVAIHEEIKSHIARRERINSVFDRIVAVISSEKSFHEYISRRNGGPIDDECYTPVVQHFSQLCEPLNANSLSLSHLYKFVNLCQLGIPKWRIVQVISQVCA